MTLKRERKSILKNVKMTPSDVERIQSKADKYCDGNFSEYVTQAALKYKSKEKNKSVNHLEGAIIAAAKE